jgi:hypothetical protein
MDHAPSPERALFERALSVPSAKRDAFLLREGPDPDRAHRIRLPNHSEPIPRLMGLEPL